MSTLNGSSPTKSGRPRIERTLKLEDAIVSLVEAEAPMTVRQVFYRLVSAGEIPKTEAAYTNTVCRLTLRLREEGRVSWDNITDNTRWIRKQASWSSLADALDHTARTYRRMVWDRMPDYVEVWSEKDAISGVLAEVTEPWDVPLMVTRGFSSVTFLHSAAATIARQGKPAHLYYFGDHDPSGVHIDVAIERRLHQFAPDAEIHFHRVAVTESQITEWNLPTRPTKKTDSRARTFKGESVEVDAIPPADLRALVNNSIVDHIDDHQLDVLAVVEESEREVAEAPSGVAQIMLDRRGVRAP